MFKEACIPEHWANISFEIPDPTLSLSACLPVYDLFLRVHPIFLIK